MPAGIQIVRPQQGPYDPESPQLLPPDFQLIAWINGWRTSWSHILSGKFSDAPYSGLFCYDKSAGFAACYRMDEPGQLELLNEYGEWENSWTHVVTGIFGDSGYDGILLYDQQSGHAAFYDMDGQGSLLLLQEHTWDTTWTKIIAAPFVDSKYSWTAFL